MRLACTATSEVYREVFANLKEGMSEKTIGELVMSGFAKMNLHGEALVLLGAAAAFSSASSTSWMANRSVPIWRGRPCSSTGRAKG